MFISCIYFIKFLLCISKFKVSIVKMSQNSVKKSKNEIVKLMKEKSEKIKIVKSNKRSQVWDIFHEIYVENVIQEYVICINCEEIYSFKNNSTSTLNSHKCKVKENQNIENFFTKKCVNESSLIQIKKETTDKLIDFCSKDLRPFNIIEGDGFKQLIQHFIKIGAKYGNIDVNEILPSKKRYQIALK